VFEAHLYFQAGPAPLFVPKPNPDTLALFRVAMTSAAVPSASTIPAKAQPIAVEPYAWVWLSAVAVLVLMLVWQLLLSQRNVLTAQEPALRPMLSTMCACEVTWPREPEAVHIESSSFTEDPKGGYIVELRLKNTQHHPVAMPALELSLTDLQDQVLVRRVFTSQDLSAKDHVLALHDVRATLNFDLDEVVSKRITGFRALVFYP
jgi:hypothetical protein